MELRPKYVECIWKYSDLLCSSRKSRCHSRPISNLASNIQRFESLRRALHMESLRLSLDSSPMLTSVPDDDEYFRCGGRLLNMQHQLRQSLRSGERFVASQPLSLSSTCSPAVSGFATTSPSVGPSPVGCAVDTKHIDNSAQLFDGFVVPFETPIQAELISPAPTYEPSPVYSQATPSSSQEAATSSDAGFSQTTTESWPGSHPMYFSPKQTVKINEKHLITINFA